MGLAGKNPDDHDESAGDEEQESQLGKRDTVEKGPVQKFPLQELFYAKVVIANEPCHQTRLKSEKTKASRPPSVKMPRSRTRQNNVMFNGSNRQRASKTMRCRKSARPSLR